MHGGGLGRGGARETSVPSCPFHRELDTALRQDTLLFFFNIYFYLFGCIGS